MWWIARGASGKIEAGERDPIERIAQLEREVRQMRGLHATVLATVARLIEMCESVLLSLHGKG